MKILGLIERKFTNQMCEGHNCNFTYKDFEDTRHQVYYQIDNKLYVALIQMHHGECYSGWTTADWYSCIVEEEIELPKFTHIPKKEMILDDEFFSSDKFVSSYINKFQQDKYPIYFVDQGDKYYPASSYSIDMSKFKRNSCR